MMYFRLLIGAAAVALSGFAAQAASLTQDNTPEPGQNLFLTLDATSTGARFFDLVFTVPSDLLFFGVADDLSDGDRAFYSPYATFMDDGTRRAGDTFFGSSFQSFLNYGGAAGEVGFRANGFAGEFETLTLGFATNPALAPGSIIPFEAVLWVGTDPNDSQAITPIDLALDILIADPNVIPLPAGGLLILTSMGALAFAARRKRRAA